MNNVLIEPTDVLFFRDAVPMAAGQGMGAGCRMPFPTTLHEALRSSLLRARGDMSQRKEVPGRPSHAIRKGNWHANGFDTDRMIASKAFRSLRTIGPLPWHQDEGVLLPVPLDAAFSSDRSTLHRLELFFNSPTTRTPASPDLLIPPCLPVATTPPDKHGHLHGWWTASQYRSYLAGDTDNSSRRFDAIPTAEIWQPENRIGVQLDPSRFSAARGQLYAGRYLRPQAQVRFAAAIHISDPRDNEASEVASLSWLLLGGEFRIARLWHRQPDSGAIPDILGSLVNPPVPTSDGPCLLKWVLITPAIFAHGNLPGWCFSATDGRPVGEVRLGKSSRKPDSAALPGRARLISWCIGKPRVVSGWDVVDERAKPTLLSIPEGSAYYFLCEDRATATALARKLHWQPRSDFYGEKGCGYGLVTFDARTHPASKDIGTLAQELFK